MRKILSLCSVLCITTLSYAQKKPLDHSVYDDWKQISSPAITPDGDVISYIIQPQEGDGKLIFHLPKSRKDITIHRGYDVAYTPDGKHAVCLIKPPFQSIRQARIRKKKAEQMPKDSLAILSFANGSITKFANVSSYRLGKDAATEVAFTCTDSTLIPRAERKKKKIGKPLIVYHFNSARKDTLRHIESYTFDNKGKSLAVVTNNGKKQSSVILYAMPDCSATLIADKHPFYSLPEFDSTGDKLLFLASSDTISSGSKHCELYYYEKGKSKPELLIGRSYQTNLPPDWAMNENSRPFFSQDASRIFVGVAPIRAPKDTTLVAFETAGLDLWHYADPLLQPAQLKNLQRSLRQTYLSVYNPSTHELQPLTTSVFDRIELINGGNAPVALSIDKTPYMVETQWDVQNNSDISLVNLTTGKRTPVSTGKYERISASPDGKYLSWYNWLERQWYLYDIAQSRTRCLTENCGVNFWDEEDDRPEYPGPYGIASWTKDDKEVLIYDAFDIWKFNAENGKVINLTAGEGRKTNRTFRYINTNPKETSRNSKKEFLRPDETLLLSVFDHVSKKSGYATLKINRNAAPTLAILDGFTFSGLQKAQNTNVYIYRKANFQTSPDMYVTSNLWKSESKLSDINPQMKEYNWGTAELFKWTAYDGTPLEGLLYKPEDFDPNKKYPVMMYFYERKSDGLYAYYAPAPSRSTVNIPFYCSRGYLVFVPDIVYKAGIPGECAYNCIVSGAESLAKNPWVDKANMAIQGQSWGGYQTAYLVTRTHLFKAAGAGAPVSNMTSAYGGIRWASGVSRQFQYEHSQSRIGRNLWEAPELYIANSPLFRADKVETPLLIMHNDNDGAVPWYQGIEYFTALRRLGKKVWMLQYNNEEHNLVERRNQKDLSVRLQQFFDHYLKGAPMPAWMKSGIPATKKGQYFGFEVETEE